VTRKRFLAPQSRLSKEEIERLMVGPLEFSAEFVKQAVRVLTRTQTNVHPSMSCQLTLQLLEYTVFYPLRARTHLPGYRSHEAGRTRLL
jgi:hypothetical protein